MERKGLTLEAIFRAKYNLGREVDIFGLIEEAITVASWEKPEEFLIGRSNLAEVLFRKLREPCSSDITNDVGSDDESGDQKDPTKTGQATSGDSITSKDNVPATEKHVNKKGRHIIRLKKKHKESVSDAKKVQDHQNMVQAKFEECDDMKKKKKLYDPNMVVQAKFETSVNKLKSRYEQIQEKKRN